MAGEPLSQLNRYICKSVLKIIELITPWDGDFLKLDFLVYVFGYGAYLFIYLYGYLRFELV